MADEFDPYAKGVEYQITQVDPTDPETKGKVYQVHKVTEEVAALLGGKTYRARIIKDPDEPTVAGKVYQVTFIDDPDDPTVKGKVYNAICTGGSAMVVVGPAVSPLDLPDAIEDTLQYVKAFGDCESRNLPEGYQELEYIEGLDNTQYINTGIIPTTNMKIYAKFSLVSGSLNNWSPFGSRKTAGGDDGLLFFGGASGNTKVDLNWLDTVASTNRWRIDNVSALGDVYEYKLENSLAEVVKNGTSLGTHQFTPDATCDQPIYINGMNNAGTPLGQTSMVFRQYRFIIAGIADMRPARRLSDGVLGMYDTIRKRFFINAGTGTFIAGRDIGGEPLPTGYTRLAYIESNGTQYIDTGLKVNQDTEIETVFQRTQLSNYFIYGITTSGNIDACSAYVTGAAGAHYWRFDDEYVNMQDVGGVIDTMWHRTIQNKNGVKLDSNNILAYTSIGTFETTANLPVFCRYVPATSEYSGFAYIRISSFVMRKNGTDVLNLVPAKRNSDSAIGMYDTVSNTFFANAGTGTFAYAEYPTPTAPQDIWCNNGAIKAVRPVEYLESTGTQYIDTGYHPNNKTKVDIKVKLLGPASSNYGEFLNTNDSDYSFGLLQFPMYNEKEIRYNYYIYKNYQQGQPNSYISCVAASSLVDKIVRIVANNQIFVYDEDGNVLCSNSVAQTPSWTLTDTSKIFKTGKNNRIYYIKFYEDDVLVRDMIPALDANNVPCLFDKVESKCYYNAGTGQFIAGYLPADYEELEYIQGYTGNSSVDPTIKAAYIDTGLVFTPTVNMYFKGGIGGYNNNSVLSFGSRPTNAYSGLSTYISGADFVTDWGGTDATGRWTLTQATVAGDIVEITTNNKTMTISKNGTVIGTNTFTGTATNNLSFYLNSRHDTGGVPSQSSPSIGRVYRFTVAGVCDMIPARKLSNGHIGMYDLVRRQFFENAGEGQFTAGKKAILPDGYTQLEYIEGTGTQWIDSGVAITGGCIIEAKAQVIDGQFLIGAAVSGQADTTRCRVYFDSANSSLLAQKLNVSATLAPINPAVPFEFRMDTTGTNLIFTVNSSVIYSNTSTSTIGAQTNNSIKIGYNNATGTSYKQRVYWCKLYSNTNMLVRYLIPAKRNSDGVVGMYDVMNDVFLTNQGTGDFAYGAEIPTETFTGYYVDGIIETLGTRSADNKNLFNGVFEQGGLYQGSLVVADTRIRTPDYISFPAGTYTISCASAYEVWIEKNNASSVNWYSSYTFTATSTDKFKIAVRSKTDPATTVIRPNDPVNVQVEAGSTATAYVPYLDGGKATCENLLGIGSTQDVQEILTGEVTRKIGVFVLTGEEWWEKLNFTGKSVFRAKVVIPDDRYSNPENNIGLCSHFTVIPTSASVTSLMNDLELAWNTNSLMCIRYDSMANLTDFLAFLRSQYDAGTPVTIVYPLATASTETVAGQTLTVSAGNNTAEIVQASIDDLELEVKYEKEG